MAFNLSLLSYLILTSVVLLTFPDHSSLSTTTATPFFLSPPPGSFLPRSLPVKNPQLSRLHSPPVKNPPIKNPLPQLSQPRSPPLRQMKHPQPPPSLPHSPLPRSSPSRHIEHSHPQPLPLQSPPSRQIEHPSPPPIGNSQPSLPQSPPPQTELPQQHPSPSVLNPPSPDTEHPTSPVPPVLNPPSPDTEHSTSPTLPVLNPPSPDTEHSTVLNPPSPDTEHSTVLNPPSPDTEHSQPTSPTPPVLNPPSPDTEHPTSPTPPAIPRTHSDQEMAAIMEALIGAGDFGSWAGLLMAAATNQFPFPILATFFVPDDVGLSDPNSKKPNSHPSIVSGLDFDPFLIPYHIVPQRLTFSDLKRCAIHSRLPTLFPDHSVLITNNSAFNFTVDDSQVTHPDLYQNAAVVMHGVSAVFDYARFGMPGSMSTSGHPSTPRLPAHPPPRPPQFHPPVNVFTPDSWRKETSCGGKGPGLTNSIWLAIVMLRLLALR